MTTTLRELARDRPVSLADLDLGPDAIVTRAGGSIKSLGGARLGGYLCVWSDKENPDRTRMKDHFHSDTKLGRFIKSGLPVFVNHGLLAGIDDLEIGEARCTPDDYGLQ